MASVVFILGAGASKQAGAPLMKDFLEEARRLWRMGKVGDANESFEVVFDGIGTLQGVHSKAQLDIENIESVFAAFEMAKTLKKFADYPPEKIGAFANAMRSVIVKTIEQTLVFPIHEYLLHPPRPYKEFGELVRYLMSEPQPKQTVTVISFNYDLVSRPGGFGGNAVAWTISS